MDIHLTTMFGAPLDYSLKAADLPVIIGRGDQADVIVDDRWVSRVHCELSMLEDQLVVRDLESKHGTYINENAVGRAAVHSGDRLELGLTTLLVELQHADSHVTQGGA